MALRECAGEALDSAEESPRVAARIETSASGPIDVSGEIVIS